MPERLDGPGPRAAAEIGIGIAAALVAVALRYALVPMVGDIAPYALVFVAVALSAVVGGWKSGLVAMVFGQLLTWFAILEPLPATQYTLANRQVAFAMATLSQLITLVIIGFYQREVDKGLAAREERLRLLDEALNEIDHRTRNNYSTVLAMVELQARRATDPAVAGALRQVADRIQAIADASKRLARRSDSLDAIRIDDHLCSLVEQIERGLSRDGIEIECEMEEATASADTTTSMSIIVNELVTNAIKHAFAARENGRVAVTGRNGAGYELVVEDNGCGMTASRRDGHVGLGSRLVESFARQLGARHEMVSSESGTVHRLQIPSLN